ncbi:MAG: hypothetical protein O2923_09840 [Verrucomicrobia bacterium]|nr:hypothetical protein [Verrucomicrobiota bacterium]MDA1088219.1 hypothetical protein [Verrucomicrobiota bacterium]
MPPRRKTTLRQGAPPAAWREASTGPLPGHTAVDAAAESNLLRVTPPPSAAGDPTADGVHETPRPSTRIGD